MSDKSGPHKLIDMAYWHPVIADELRKLSDEWEADRAALERVTLDHSVALSKKADNLLRAERAEAALERARALVARWKAEANPSEPALSASVVFLAHSMADELAAALGEGGRP